MQKIKFPQKALPYMLAGALLFAAPVFGRQAPQSEQPFSSQKASQPVKVESLLSKRERVQQTIDSLQAIINDETAWLKEGYSLLDSVQQFESQLKSDGKSLDAIVNCPGYNALNLISIANAKRTQLGASIEAMEYSDSSATFFGKGDYEKAISYATNAICLEPDSASNYFYRGKAYYSAASNPFTNYASLAVGDFQTVIELSKNEQERDQAQAQIDIVQSARNDFSVYFALGGIFSLVGAAFGISRLRKRKN